MTILSFGRASLVAQVEPQHAAPEAGAQSGLRSSPAVLDRVPPERLALLARGINLNAWFAPWANPAAYGTSFRPDEAAFLRRAGFTVCRLPLAPDLLFDPADPGRPKPAIRYVDAALRMLLGAGLAVILDPIHGSSSSDEWERGLDHDPGFLAAAETYWEALARHYAAFSKSRIFFEIMNEPHLSAREKVDPSWWQPVQAELAAAIRRGAPSNTIVATGEKWGGIDGLVALEPLADRNVVYSFHYYDPMTFTHQGASWTGPLQAELSGIPYPSSPEAVAAAASELADPRARSQVLRYGDERWDESRIKAELERAAAWGATHRVPVFCGEFGVYRKVAPPAARLRWISDVRRSLESLGIGWSMWDYETDFGLVSYDEPSWRRGIRVDSGCLAALGLDTKATIAPWPEEPTLADFVSGKVGKIEIPVEDWSRLWTRDPGSGEERAVDLSSGGPEAVVLDLRGARDWSLGSGLAVPVKPGEELRLSARAAVEGPGSLRLEFVARDAAGKVISWDYGSVAAPALAADAPAGNEAAGSAAAPAAGTAVGPAAGPAAGPVAEPFQAGPATSPGSLLVTEVVVARDIATLEPRWSGTGRATLRLGSFTLERTGRVAGPSAPGPLKLSNGTL
jgi:endoglucanase